MCVEHRNLPWTPLLLLLSGAFCNEWKVEYEQQDICAVKGTSVVIPCTFYYPEKEIVQRVMWSHGIVDIFYGPFIFDSNMTNTNTTSNFEYIGEKEHNCSFKIHQVEHSHGGKYTFRFWTNSEQGKWTGRAGSTLKVLDLKITLTKPDGHQTTREGDSVSLSCINGCERSARLPSAFTWFKNGEHLMNQGPVLHLSNTSFTHSGNYTCSLKRHMQTTSGVIHIDVEYGPKNTTVSITPLTEVDAGSNITLICNSHAHPPVENYTWFKIDDHDGIVAVGHLPVLFSGEGGQYVCRATNKHGSQNSSVVPIKMQAYWETLTRDVLIISTVAVSVIVLVTVVIALRRYNTGRTGAPVAQCEEDTQNTDYVNWPVFDVNQSREGSWCERWTDEIAYATVDFNTKRKPNMGQQMDSYHTNHDHNEDHSVIYSTVCRSQLLNPSYVELL